MFASQHGEADHRVLVDSDQAAGLTDAATLLQMLEYRERFFLGKFRTVQRRAFAFREALLAGAAGQDTTLLVGPITETDAQIVAAAVAVVEADGVQAAKVFQVVHGAFGWSQARRIVGEQLESA